MDGTPVLVEGILSDFIAEYENVRGRRPRRLYVTWGEYEALLAGDQRRQTVFVQPPPTLQSQDWMFDGAWLRRSKAAAAIRAWDLTPF